MSANKNTKQPVGLVLSGGGGKGAYEVGVWKALDEFGITPNIKAVSGTSVGALNSVLFAQGDLHLALHMWHTISPGAVMTLNNSPAYQTLESTISALLRGTRFFDFAHSLNSWVNKRFADQGLLSKNGLSNLINTAIDPNLLAVFTGPIYVAAYNITFHQLKYFDLSHITELNVIKERLLASASIPVIFGKTYIDGDLYWDGGIPVVGDNTPVKPLYDAGYRNLIVVHLSREVPVDRKRFPNCNIVEIMPQEDLGGIVSGTMNFTPEAAEKNIELGYQDTLRILAPLFQTGRALSQVQDAMQEISQEQERFTEQYCQTKDQIQCSGKAVDTLLEKLNERGSL